MAGLSWTTNWHGYFLRGDVRAIFGDCATEYEGLSIEPKADLARISNGQSRFVGRSFRVVAIDEVVLKPQ